MRIRNLIAAMMLACVAVVGLCFGDPPAPATAPTTQPLAVWYQPVSSFATWKSRGVTILMGYEGQSGTVSCDAWCKAAQAQGLQYILQSTTPGLTSAHWNDANCAAVVVSIDEPNQLNSAKQFPIQVFAQAMAIRAATAKPIFINLDGSQLEQESDAEIWGYCQCADWIGCDRYALNNGQGMAVWDTNVKATAARLHRLAAGKRILLGIESSDQNLRKQNWVQAYPATRDAMRGPTPREYAHLVLSCRAWDCMPFIFPDQIGQGWEGYDGTTPGVDGAMQAMIAQP